MLFHSTACYEQPTENRNITGLEPGEWYLFPTWSPTGEWIAYEHYAVDSLWGIWMARPDGSDAHFVTKGILPDFSPDGKKLALVGSEKIFVYDLETKEQRQLTFDVSNFFPSWSPGGGKIAYDSNFQDPKGANVIWIMDSDGSNKKDISQHGIGEWRSPDWFPDYRILHLRYARGTGAEDLFVMDTTGQNVIQLTQSGEINWNARVSPNGRSIVWERKEFKNNELAIWLMNADGSDKVRLTDGFEPAWAPDSRHIIFRKRGEYVPGQPYDDDDPKVHGSLWIMKVETKEQWQFLPKN